MPIAWLNMAIKVDCLGAPQSSSQPSSSLVQFLELSGGGTLLLRPRRPGDRFFTSKERSFKTFLHRRGGRHGQTLKNLLRGGEEPASLAYGVAMRRLFGESGRGLAIRLLPVLAAGDQVLWAPALAFRVSVRVKDSLHIGWNFYLSVNIMKTLEPGQAQLANMK
ncbi:MAG: hypothetical protein HC888_13410 [Candidatus Competibacteraceae bacterium]|nr:hypothetical protein [Candidatus Competibacteraceae bacterium]